MSVGVVRDVVLVVDDDPDLAASVARLLGRHGFVAMAFTDPAVLLADDAEIGGDIGRVDCVVTDVMMGDMDGFAFARALRLRDPLVAVVFMTAWPTTSDAVDAVRLRGGIDYLEKPLDEDRLVAAVAEGCAWSRRRRAIADRTAALSVREREVFALLVRGHSNKAIAATLGLSPKTIEDHRAAVFAKTGTMSIAQLIALTD